MACSGILLAGGASRRFPPNKLLVDLDGQPLFWHALRALAQATDEVVIVVGANAPDPALPALAVSVHIAHDAEPDAGPLVALAAGLAAVSAPQAIIAAGDTPAVPPALLVALRDELGATSADIVSLLAGERRSVLPSALRVAPARRSVDALVATGERRLRALLDGAALEVKSEAWWRRLDPRGSWLRDVDRPEDLGESR